MHERPSPRRDLPNRAQAHSSQARKRSRPCTRSPNQNFKMRAEWEEKAHRADVSFYAKGKLLSIFCRGPAHSSTKRIQAFKLMKRRRRLLEGPGRQSPISSAFTPVAFFTQKEAGTRTLQPASRKPSAANHRKLGNGTPILFSNSGKKPARD